MTLAGRALRRLFRRQVEDPPAAGPGPEHTLFETVILPYFQYLPEVRSVLFAGPDSRARRYGETCFSGKDYWTLDPALLDKLARYFGSRLFDLIVCDGIAGGGSDDPERLEQAFRQCRARLRPQGYLLVGWDDTPARSPPVDEAIASLGALERFEFPPLAAWRYACDTPNRHTYAFYRRGQEPTAA